MIPFTEVSQLGSGGGRRREDWAARERGHEVLITLPSSPVVATGTAPLKCGGGSAYVRLVAAAGLGVGG